MTRIEATERPSKRFAPNLRMTDHVASRVGGGAHVPEDLDWQTFAAACFPGRRRHDLEALTAYGLYRRPHAGDARSSAEPARIDAGPGQAGSTALQDWEDEGGSAR